MNEIQYNAPLLGMQKFMLDYQFNCPKSTMHNLHFLLKWSLAVDEKLLLQAVMRAFQAHPILNSVFYFAEDGDLWQKKLADKPMDLAIEYVNEAELETIKTTLVQPFFLTNQKMYRCRLFKTEAALYLFLDIHHSIIDGVSLYILVKNIAKAYRGQNVPVETYSFYHAVWDELDKREKYKNFDARQYYEALLQGWDGRSLPKMDDAVDGNFFLDDNFSVLDITVKELNPLLKRFSIDENVFFMTVMALTNAVYNETDDLVFTWIHHGRNSLKQSKLVGLMLKEHLIRIGINNDMTIKALFDLVTKAKEQSMEDAFYPYYEYVCLESKNEIPSFMFQGNIKSAFDIGGEPYGTEDLPNLYEATSSSWDVELTVEEDRYSLLVEYRAGFYKEESVAKWAALFNAVAKRLLCAATIEEIKQPYE